MSYDYTVYAKTRKRSIRSVREAAKVVLARYDEGLALSPPDDEQGEDEIWIDGLGGPIQIAIHGFGFALSLSSTTGARRNFNRLGEVAEAIAAYLGTVLSEEEVSKLLEREEEAEAPPPPPPPKPHGAAILLVDRVVLVLLGAAGEQLHRATTSIPQFNTQRRDRDGLAPRLVDKNAPAILSEDGRRKFGAKVLRCTLHGKSGTPVCHYEYQLDDEGRVTSFKELAAK